MAAPTAPATVLLLGSGGREHALATALAASPGVSTVYVAPGNAGTGAMTGGASVRNVDLEGNAEVVAFSKEHGVDLVVVGPEAPLAAGVAGVCTRRRQDSAGRASNFRAADALNAAGVPCFGPSAAAARIESSKAFAKAAMARFGVPTAAGRAFTDADAAEGYIRAAGHRVVVKASGLAAGKGTRRAMA